MNYFITYGDKAYSKSREYAVKKAKKYGFDIAIGYSEKDIDPEFYEKYKNILSAKFGGGFWLWKPYVILKTLLQVSDGDIVFYSDSGACFVKPSDNLLSLASAEDVVLFSGDYKEKCYTKPELLKMMNCDNDLFKESLQVNAAFCIFRKSNSSIAFVQEWLDWCCHDGALTLDTIYHEFPPTEFKYGEHRSDQSVLSLLAKQKCIAFHLDPTQFGRKSFDAFPDDKYDACIVHHRGTKPRFIILYWLCCVTPRPVGIWLFEFAWKINKLLHRLNIKRIVR